MNSMNHPEAEQLNAYVRDPMASDYRQIRLHLAACVACRQQVDLLSSLKLNLHDIEATQYQDAVSQNDELHEILQSQLIEKYVDDKLEPAEQQHVGNMVKEDAQAMKAALHYASHSARMQRASDGDVGTFVMSDSNNRADSNHSSGMGALTLLRRWLEIRSPVWLTIPATAAIASLLSVVFIPQLGHYSERQQIIAYQDNPVIQFKHTQALPGIGFFSEANKVIKPYARLSAHLSANNDIQLSWPRVDNAVSYTMHLKMFSKGQQVSLGKLTTAVTQASFKRAANDKGQRYIWSLSGKTRDGVLFSTKGGFIINSGND